MLIGFFRLYIYIYLNVHEQQRHIPHIPYFKLVFDISMGCIGMFHEHISNMFRVRETRVFLVSVALKYTIRTLKKTEQ